MNDESRAHDSAAAFMLNSGSVVIKRHRGGGFASTDYTLQFRGNTFVADVKLMSGVCFYWEIEIIHSYGMPFFGVCTATPEADEATKWQLAWSGCFNLPPHQSSRRTF